MRPRIFISTVSAEFASTRQLIANILTRLGYDPVWQDIFGTEPGDLRQVLRDKIDSCQGLIHLAGHAYGFEPPEPDPGFGRCSYTQFELLYAQKQGKKTWLIFPGDDCERDTPLHQLDLPEQPQGEATLLSPAEPGADGDARDKSVAAPWALQHQQERRQLQAAYRARLEASSHLRHTVNSTTELENAVLKLRDDSEELRREFRDWQAHLEAGQQRLETGQETIQSGQKRQSGVLRWVLGGLVLLLFLGSGAFFYLKHQSEQGIADIQAGQTVDAADIEARILQAADLTRQTALQAAAKLPSPADQARASAAAESEFEATRARAAQMSREYARLMGDSSRAATLAREMTAILADKTENGGVGPALDHYEAARDRIRAQRHQAHLAETARRAEYEADLRASLRADLTAAGLYTSQGRHSEARAAYREVLDLQPDWPEALADYLWFLFDRTVFEKTHGSLARAVELAQEALPLARRLQALPEEAAHDGDGKSDGDEDDPFRARRAVSATFAQLGDVLVIRGQPGDRDAALGHYEEALEMNRQLHRANPESGAAARDVSVSLNKLGDFLRARNQPGDAEAALGHYEESLEMRRQLHRANPESGQAARDVSVSLDSLGDFLRARGQPGDAEAALGHYEASLEMRRQLHRANPESGQAARDVSVSLDSLGDFLSDRNQPGNAVAALGHYEESLEIRRQLHRANPESGVAARDVSISLNRLGDFLRARGQPGDDEAALGHYQASLEIRRQLHRANPESGVAARDVSVSLDKLGDFLSARGQPGDAEAALGQYEESLEIRRQLQRANPESGQAARDVSVSLVRMYSIYRDMGKPEEEALAYLKECFEILDSFAREGRPMDAQMRQVHEMLKGLFGQ